MIVQNITKKTLFEFQNLPIVMFEDKSIFHIQKGKEIKQRLNCRSLGYWIDRRFYTLSKLNKLAKKVKKEIVVEQFIKCPF